MQKIGKMSENGVIITYRWKRKTAWPRKSERGKLGHGLEGNLKFRVVFRNFLGNYWFFLMELTILCDFRLDFTWKMQKKTGKFEFFQKTWFSCFSPIFCWFCSIFYLKIDKTYWKFLIPSINPWISTKNRKKPLKNSKNCEKSPMA